MEAVAIMKGQNDDEMEVSLRGKSDAVINALIHGLPPEALMQLHDAIGAELSKRKQAVAKDSAGSKSSS